MTWKDKRDVNLISTMHDTSQAESGRRDRTTDEPILKPKLVLDYNKRMGGVDTSDMLTNAYGSQRKSLKWYKKLVYHLSDLSATNAFFLYKKVTGNVKLSHYDFTEAICNSLINVACDTRPLPKRPGRQVLEPVTRLQYRHSNHWPVFIEASGQAKKGNPTRVCVVCKPQKRSETRYECLDCRVALHPQCFVSYHTLQNF